MNTHEIEKNPDTLVLEIFDEFRIDLIDRSEVTSHCYEL